MIYLGADHRGYDLKEKIKSWLSDLGHEYKDCGASALNKDDDYTDFANIVAVSVAKDLSLGEPSRGILICGSGIGVAVAANKTSGIRAGTAMAVEQIRASVNDEDLNVLAISADYTKEEDVKNIVETFLDTKFSGEERHVRRLNKIRELEK